MRRLIGLSLLVMWTTACKAKGADRAATDSTAVTAPARATAPITTGGTIAGTVLEVIPVESYLYLRLRTADGEVWTAVNQSPLEVGANVTIYNVLPMEQFASPTLKRTFARIYFGSLEPVAPAPDAVIATTGTPAARDAGVGAVAPASGSGAQTVASLWREKARLGRATVAVRGIVVKYNAGVMGKNWIHLQDGSGDPVAGTHDLAATTLEAASVGDTVTLMGVVRTNVDVGAGYKYALLLENARVVAR
ncbi:MAG TPA: hypothetical protein VE869_03625 [Gemmatimonas sp.]|nr:hypothetical protein [Gemmatimonas sp.]